MVANDERPEEVYEEAADEDIDIDSELAAIDEMEVDLTDLGLPDEADEFSSDPEYIATKILEELFGSAVPVKYDKHGNQIGSWPVRLTDGVRRVITQATQVGANLMFAGYAAGIDRGLLTTWLRWGEEDLSDGVNSPCVRLYLEVLIAQGQSQHRWLSRINEAAEAGDWKAAAWQLSKRWPHVYGDKIETTVKDPDGALKKPQRVEIFVTQGELVDPDTDPADEA